MNYAMIDAESATKSPKFDEIVTIAHTNCYMWNLYTERHTSRSTHHCPSVFAVREYNSKTKCHR